MPLTTTSTHGPRRAPAISRRGPLLVALVLTLIVMLALLVIAPGRASAVPRSETQPSPSAPSQTPPTPNAPDSGSQLQQAPSAPDSVTPNLEPTTIRISPADFSPTGSVRISGTRQHGSMVTVTLEPADELVCVVPAANTPAWSCPPAQLPNGAGLALVATEEPGPRDPVPSPASAVVDVLRPPLLDGDGILLTTGLVSGAGEPGSTVTVSVDGQADARCAAVPVTADARWSCTLSSPSGTYEVRAQQSNPAIGGGAPSAYSISHAVTVDRELPTRAIIASPVTGFNTPEASITVSGLGEDDATVDLYLDDVPSCSSTVVEGSWSCVLGSVPVGDHVIRALQRDAAGNFAPPGESVSIERTAAASAPASPPSNSPSNTPYASPSNGAGPVPSATSSAVPGSPASPSPAIPSPAPVAPVAPVDPDATDDPVVPAPGDDAGGPGAGSGGGSEAIADARSWAAPTGFGAALPSARSVGGAWYVAPLTGLLFLALVALPLRLLVTALRRRIPLPRVAILGRNRGREASRSAAGDAPAALPRALVVLGVATALILFAVGVAGEVRYLRLLLAVALGLVVLNTVGAAMSTRLGARRLGIDRRMRLLPLMLLAAVATALLSRMADIDSPVVAGVLFGPALAAATRARARGILNLVHLSAVTALGLIAWLLHEAVGPIGVGAGFWAAFVSETLATVCVAGLWSALILVLPIADLPGRVLLEWSPAVWAGAALVVAGTVASTVGGASAGPVLAHWMLGAAAFAALALSAWAFMRFAEPRAAT